MNQWAEDTIRANGITIHYRRTGAGRRPVVLLHGLTDNGACWAHLAADLAADYDLIMPDARGHGRSEGPADGYTTEAFAADVLALIDALGLEQPALVGHSMGGVAAAMAATMAPERLRGLVLEDPAFRSPEAWAERAVGNNSVTYREAMAFSDETLAAQGRAANPRWRPDVFPPWVQAKREFRPQTFSWFAHDHPATNELVARVGVPTLLITGDPSLGAIVSPTAAAELCALNPLIHIAHLPRVGHCIRYEQPERYAALVRAFLAELP